MDVRTETLPNLTLKSAPAYPPRPRGLIPLPYTRDRIRGVIKGVPKLVLSVGIKD